MIYMDLGMSSMQVDAWERGFSYSYRRAARHADGPAPELSAADLVNEWPESRIAAGAAPIRRGALRRRDRPRDRPAPPAARRPPSWSTRSRPACRRRPASARGHPAKRTFQAIRIAVNGELDALDDGAAEAWEMLAAGGRLAAISFHSLEDRPSQAVPRRPGDAAASARPSSRSASAGASPRPRLITQGRVAPSAGEIADNPRSTSAHLRVALKLEREAGS